jgi:N-acyl-D-amino-acid deacylase
LNEISGMRFIVFILLVPFISSAQDYCDILITNGRILDGTGNSWFYGNVAIKDGKIMAVGPSINLSAKETINAAGKLIAPGFIDVHTHIEDDEMENPAATNFIMDGVTTVITGNCGSSRVDIGSYFKKLDSLHLSINVATLVGHNDVRKAVMGRANREPNKEELERMKQLVDRGMKDGAVGLSTGLIYIPGTYSKTPEIVELARVATKYHGVYASHMRSESDSVTQAIDEALTVGKQAGIPVEISHFKVGGRQNWGRSTQTLQMIKDARLQGIDVTIDQYPYTASSTSLSTLLPDAVLADGTDSIRARLANKDIRNTVKKELVKGLRNKKLKHFSYVMIAYYNADTTLNGKSIEQINQQAGRKHKATDEAETILQMVEKGGAQIVSHGMSEDDVKYIMQYPFNMFASDASIRIFNKGVPHPRGYGTNARILGKYVREEKVISIEEAVRRMTSLPAQKFRLNNRGLIKEGYAADIVVFDENEVIDLSTFDQPHQYSKGFQYVIVNGKITAKHGAHTGIRNGAVVRRS